MALRKDATHRQEGSLRFQVTSQPCLQQVFIIHWRNNRNFREQIANSGYMKPNIALRKTMKMGNCSYFKSSVRISAMNPSYGYADLNIIYWFSSCLTANTPQTY